MGNAPAVARCPRRRLTANVCSHFILLLILLPCAALPCPDSWQTNRHGQEDNRGEGYSATDKQTNKQTNMETVVCARLGRVLVAATSFVLFFLFFLFFWFLVLSELVFITNAATKETRRRRRSKRGSREEKERRKGSGGCTAL